MLFSRFTSNVYYIYVHYCHIFFLSACGIYVLLLLKIDLRFDGYTVQPLYRSTM